MIVIGMPWWRGHIASWQTIKARTCMRHGVGGNPQYRELWDVAYEHCCEVVNNAPENGGQSPLQKLQQDYPHVNTVDMVEE